MCRTSGTFEMQPIGQVPLKCKALLIPELWNVLGDAA